MEINPACPIVDKGTEVEISRTSDSVVVAKSVLVSHDFTDDETPGSPSNISTPICALGRLEAIRQNKINNGLSEDEATYLEECVRSSTAKAYDNGWQKWVQWCIDNQLDYRTYDIDHLLLRFFFHHKDYSPQHLNTLRSCIASVFKYIHSSKPAIASNIRIQALFASRRRKKVKVPAIEQLETWDTDILVSYIRNNWQMNNDLNIEDLQLKTLGLLCLASMARPRSDIGRHRHDDIRFRYNNTGKITGVILHFRQA